MVDERQDPSQEPESSSCLFLALHPFIFSCTLQPRAQATLGNKSETWSRSLPRRPQFVGPAPPRRAPPQLLLSARGSNFASTVSGAGRGRGLGHVTADAAPPTCFLARSARPCRPAPHVVSPQPRARPHPHPQPWRPASSVRPSRSRALAHPATPVCPAGLWRGAGRPAPKPGPAPPSLPRRPRPE